mmetsp:Transcript_9149/g.10565  ORF Transcript_9149/g.10565 Transcript_9149/m.10565 type:complete len:546 (+) Transcript_9149:2-1639(+)
MAPLRFISIRSRLQNAGRKVVAAANPIPSSSFQSANFSQYTGLRAGSQLLGSPRRAAAFKPSLSRARQFSVSASEEYDYDLFTIGAGSGGVRCSRMSTSHGAKAAVAEMPYSTQASDTTGGVGGTCVIRGCVPKKLLVYGSHYATDFKDCEGFGWTIPEKPTFDWKKLIANKNKELNRLTGIYGRILSGADVELVQGRGKIIDPHTVEVDGKRITAKHILVATGGRAFVPDIPGKELVITSDEALDLPELPKKICIVGSGYIALEFACIFNNFGCEVHVFYRQPLPLRGFDEEVREFLANELANSGIHMHPNSSPTAVEKTDDGYTLVTTNGSESADQVMFATGRKPNVANLGLEEVGVEMNANGSIKVDEYSHTNIPSIHAIGDVTDRINLTPVALMEGTALANTLFNDTPTKPDHTNVPCAVFTQPTVATVGLTEAEATEKFKNIDIYTSSFRPMKNTISGSEEKMFMKLIVDVASDKVVGVHIVGPESGEMMQGVAVAVKMGATKAQFDQCIGIHPTAAEEFVTMRTVSRQVREPAAEMAQV